MNSLSKDAYSWTHVKEIPNTRYLVSLHHAYETFANMEIFDISRKGQAKKIYSYEIVLGGNISKLSNFYRITNRSSLLIIINFNTITTLILHN